MSVQALEKKGLVWIEDRPIEGGVLFMYVSDSPEIRALNSNILAPMHPKPTAEQQPESTPQNHFPESGEIIKVEQTPEINLDLTPVAIMTGKFLGAVVVGAVVLSGSFVIAVLQGLASVVNSVGGEREKTKPQAAVPAHRVQNIVHNHYYN